MQICARNYRMSREPDHRGDARLAEVTAAVYNELRKLAGGYLRRDPLVLTLQPTVLVHEVYLRMAGEPSLEWANRGHFFGIAARCMRQILVDHARARNAFKRGGGTPNANLDSIPEIGTGAEPRILAMNDALEALAEIDPRKGKVVELYYFGGLSYEEIAESLEISDATVKRDLQMARAWLLREMTGTRP